MRKQVSFLLRASRRGCPGKRHLPGNASGPARRGAQLSAAGTVPVN